MFKYFLFSNFLTPSPHPPKKEKKKKRKKEKKKKKELPCHSQMDSSLSEYACM